MFELFFFYYRIRFLLMVRFVNGFFVYVFLFFVIVGCSLDTGLLLSDEMRQIVSGAIVQGSDEENKLAIKVCLEFITMCCNMSDVRVDATDSALQYLFTNSKNNSFQSNLHFKRKSTFLSDDDDGSTDGELTDTAGGKCRTITTTAANEGASKVDKTWTLSYQMSTIFKYDLHFNN